MAVSFTTKLPRTAAAPSSSPCPSAVRATVIQPQKPHLAPPFRNNLRNTIGLANQSWRTRVYVRSGLVLGRADLGERMLASTRTCGTIRSIKYGDRSRTAFAEVRAL